MCAFFGRTRKNSELLIQVSCLDPDFSEGKDPDPDPFFVVVRYPDPDPSQTEIAILHKRYQKIYRFRRV